jgi:hypothetical protein
MIHGVCEQPGGLNGLLFAHLIEFDKMHGHCRDSKPQSRFPASDCVVACLRSEAAIEQQC